MNKLIAFLAAPLVAISSLFAAENTLFTPGDSLTHGGFGAPVVKMSQVDGHGRLLVGGEGGWIINHGFYLGLGGYGMVEGITTDSISPEGDRQYMQMGYGGILTGYTFQSDALFHLGIQQLLGAGGMTLTDRRWGEKHDKDYDEDRGDDQVFFVWEPQLNGELNVTRWMRVAVGAGYRLTWLPEKSFGFADNDLGGPVASLALKFGKF